MGRSGDGKRNILWGWPYKANSFIHHGRHACESRYFVDLHSISVRTKLQGKQWKHDLPQSKSPVKLSLPQLFCKTFVTRIGVRAGEGGGDRGGG